MKLIKNKKVLMCLSGLLIGTVNGLMGAGGGMLAVPLLKKCGMEQKSAHVNAVAVILPICIMSAGLYLYKGNVSFSDALPYIPAGVVGSVAGTLIIKKISPVYLKRIFAALMIYSGIRLILK